MNNIGEIIVKHRKKFGLKQQDFANELSHYGIHIGKTAVCAWETGASQPNASQLLAICQMLKITDIYSEFIGINPADPLSELNEEGRKKALDYIQLLLKSGEYRKDSYDVQATRMIRIYDLPVSAGTGSFLDSDEYRTVKVGSEVPMLADFGVKVSGDSMEPRFINGQTVWVQHADTLENGEIGIFCLNNNAYIKKLQSDADGILLVSLNVAYRPLIIGSDDDFRVFGRIIG